MDNLTKNIILTPFNLLYRVNPELTLKILFRIKMGYQLNLDEPKTYNEKLQWIKLYDRNPLMAKCCDKYLVREYVESKGYGYILNELLWQGYDPKEIPFDDLPEKCVIKATHGSTFNLIVENIKEIDREKIIKQCNRWLKTKFLPCYGEWFYGVERPRIIIEKYLEGEGKNPLFDYKIFCFNGIPRMAYVDTWKNGHHAINAYDMDMNLFKGVQLGYPNDDQTTVTKPKCWDEMIQIAKRLSEDFLHVRVDFYETQEKVVFGELTFTKSAGFGKIRPKEFDLKMGNWLTLQL